MAVVRDIARELLPYVVMFWATFALLGGALEHTKHVEHEDGRAAAQAVVGLCTITVACAIKAAVGRIRPLLRRIFKLSSPRPASLGGRRPAGYHKPPPYPPSLERLQVLRL